MAYGIGLNARERAVLKDLAKQKGMSQKSILRLALRFYQSFDVKISRGEINQQDINRLLDNGLRKKR